VNDGLTAAWVEIPLQDVVKTPSETMMATPISASRPAIGAGADVATANPRPWRNAGIKTLIQRGDLTVSWAGISGLSKDTSATCAQAACAKRLYNLAAFF
jgi:hypothetical protein